MDNDGLRELGRLSEQYETPHPGPAGAGVVANTPGDPGGASYGSYQLATAPGTVARFVAWLAKRAPVDAAALAGKAPGSPEFDRAWRALAAKDAQGFFEAQHDFIGATHYVPARDTLEASTGMVFAQRSRVLRDVLWSTAVQHGPRGAVRVWGTALAGADPATLTDAAIVHAVYAERGRRKDGQLVHFRSASRAVQAAVLTRFRSELATALAELPTP